jgi:hypothetical protein
MEGDGRWQKEADGQKANGEFNIATYNSTCYAMFYALFRIVLQIFSRSKTCACSRRGSRGKMGVDQKAERREYMLWIRHGSIPHSNG